MEWESLYCPNRNCRHYGKPFKTGQLIKDGSSRGHPRALCRACGRHVVLSYGTAYCGLDAEPAVFELAVRALAEGTSLRATARIVLTDKDTVCAWLDRAARQCRRVMLYLWHDLHVQECQLDELWSFVHTKQANLPGAKSYHETYGDAWVWLAFAPEWRLVLAFVIGKRTQTYADQLLARVRQVTDLHIPFFTSDQWPEYEKALLMTYGEWYQPVRRGPRGPQPKPRRRPLPEMQYAQVIKIRQQGRVVKVKTHVVFGDTQTVAAYLQTSPVSGGINTSFVERDNLTQRQSNRRLTRRTIGFSKDLQWFEKQLWVSLAYYHLVLPHRSLRQPLVSPEPTRGHGTLRRWSPVTPAMAAGMTDHVWTTAELLSYRVPAEFIDQLPKLEQVFPDFAQIHHSS
jgi:IS1 family transposase/transposase-like protein